MRPNILFFNNNQVLRQVMTVIYIVKPQDTINEPHFQKIEQKWVTRHQNGDN